MTHSFLVLVSGKAENPLTDSLLSAVQSTLQSHDISCDKPHWLRPHKAAEISLSSAPSHELFETIKNQMSHHAVDVFLTPAEHRQKKLLLADMDATIVAGETLDDLAEQAGLKDKISEITARAMRGELDFKEALELRVGMLKNLSLSALQTTLSLMTINQGAVETIKIMREHGAKCYLVSGGFTYFTGAIAEICGFDGHHGNNLEIENELLTGRVIPPILDKDAKLSFLKHYTESLGLSPLDTMAVGDGANDIPMLVGAGCGVGYFPKPLVREKIANIIVHTDLTSLLYIQGYDF